MDPRVTAAFDKSYQGFSVGIDVYDSRKVEKDRVQEYLVYFPGRPAKELWWVEEDLLSPQLMQAFQ